MSGQDVTTTAQPIDQAVAELLDEMEKAEASQNYCVAQATRMRCAIQQAALEAHVATIQRLAEDSYAIMARMPSLPEGVLAQGIRDADAEGRRLIAALGIELPEQLGA